MVAVRGMSYLLAKCLLSPRQGSPRTHSSSRKQLLGQVEGRVYFPVYIVDVYPQCQWNTECDSDGKLWTIVLHSWGSPEFFSHPRNSFDYFPVCLDTTVHLMKLLLFSVCRLVTCHTAVPCRQNCSVPLSIPTVLVLSKPVSTISRLAVSFPSSPGKHLALLTVHGNSRLSHCGECKPLLCQAALFTAVW